jgi:hypothetical protein
MSTKRERKALLERLRKNGLGELKGARKRELAARYLLLHLDAIPTASVEDLKSLDEYVSATGWKSLYGHDRGMYRLLRRGAEILSERKREK